MPLSLIGVSGEVVLGAATITIIILKRRKQAPMPLPAVPTPKYISRRKQMQIVNALKKTTQKSCALVIVNRQLRLYTHDHAQQGFAYAYTVIQNQDEQSVQMQLNYIQKEKV